MSNLKLKVNKRVTNYYTVCIEFYVISNIFFRYSNIDFIFGISKYKFRYVFDWFTIIYLIIMIIQNFKYTKKTIFIIICATILLIIQYYVTNDFQMIIDFLFIVAAKDIDYSRVVSRILKVICISVATVMMLSFLGIIHSSSDGIFKSYGFVNKNLFSIQLLQISLCIIYLRYENIRFRDFLAIIIMAIFSLFVSGSRTSGILMLLSVALVLVTKLLQRINAQKILYNILGTLSFILPIIFVYLVNIYDGGDNKVSTINNLLSGRLYQTKMFIENYNFSLFGQKVLLITNQQGIELKQSYSFLDNAYIYLGLEYGVIIFALLLIGYLFIIKDSIKNDYAAIIICSFIYLMVGLSEIVFIYISFNFTIIFLSKVLYRYKKSNNKEKT